MKPRILLISPIFSEIEATGKTQSMRQVMNVIPPLGLGYIAAVLEQNGFYVKIVDGSLGLSYDKLGKILRIESPDMVGLSATTPSFEACCKTGAWVRRILPNATIIIGGSHVTALPRETMKNEIYNIGVIGEGEMTFLELANRFSQTQKNLSRIDGIVFRQGENVRVNRPRRLIDDLDSLPFPARHLMPPLDKYKPTPASYRRLPQAHIMTSRGCPCNCSFCDNAIFGRTYRERSTENIMEEIDELISAYNVKDIKFFDDNFTLNKRRLYRICEEMKKRKLVWSCLTRVNLVDRQMLKTMKRSGCWQVLFGLESGDPELLKNLGKGTTVRQNIRAVRWAQQAGLNIRADFIVGTPDETRRSLRRTINLAKRLNVDFAHFNKFTPYPGTVLYERLLKEGYKFDFSKSCSQLDHSIVLYSPRSFTHREFSETIDCAHKEYYLRPQYLFKQLFSIRSFVDIDRMIRGFFAIYGL